MRVPSQLRAERLEFNMTPMIDVVFLLVIFFLVSSHLAQRETRLDLPLPEATTGIADDRDVERVTLNISQDQLLLGSSPLPIGQLADRLKGASEKKGTLELRIRADQEVEYARVAPVLKAAAEAGVWDVNLAVRRASGPQREAQP
jgi:biopolymer transport protein ExbD